MNKIYPMLYKRTSTGKIQTWQGEVSEGKYRSTAGFIDGVKNTTEWTYCRGKNIGKANGTTDETQAIAQMDAIYKKKLEKEYFLSIEEIDQKRYFKPMLAKKWQEVKHKITSEQVFMQPKLDGIRCVLKQDGLWSRQGKQLLSTPHIHEIVLDLYSEHFANNPGLMFDGELYNHQFRDDFNRIISLVRKTKPTASDLRDAEQLIQYWVYDTPSMGSAPFSERLGAMTQNWSDNPSLVLVDTKLVNLTDVDETAMEWIAQGYEGAMVRLDGAYETDRSMNLIKWKEFQDDEFLIVDILPGNGGHANIASKCVMVTPEGNQFSAGLLGSHEFCAELLANKAEAIGKMGTCVYQNLTPDGIPRFGKLKSVREYE